MIRKKEDADFVTMATHVSIVFREPSTSIIADWTPRRFIWARREWWLFKDGCKSWIEKQRMRFARWL